MSIKDNFFFKVERYLLRSNSLTHKIISYLLLPISAIYTLVVLFKKSTNKVIDYKIPIISVGNIIVGGSGKTPFLISLAKNIDNPAVILRGYKRKSKGLKIISKRGKIILDVKDAGDEAMLVASLLPNATVIVSKNRDKAILEAIKHNVKVIFLDDGFSKAHIKKLDILLKPNPSPNSSFCLPSGPYREPKSFYKRADIIAVDKLDFKRVVTIENKTERMVLVTAISNPKRLDIYLPNKLIIKKIYYPDHYYFKKDEIKKIIDKYNPLSILTTQKDAVKLKDFNISISIMKLKIVISSKIEKKVSNFINL